MNFKVLKLAVIGGFLAFAGLAFVFSENEAGAQQRPETEKRENVLAKVRNYKTWKLVSKPDAESSTDVFKIFGSSLGG